MHNFKSLPGRMKWIIAAGMLGLIAVGVILLRVMGGGGEDDAWERISATGVLRVGMDAAYPPFESLNEHNEVVGFDVDLGNEIGQRLGVEMAYVNMAYDGLYDALLIGQVDILISALVAAPEFEGKADFSTPYFNIGEHLVVPDNSSIQSIDDLAGRMVAVEIGSGGDVEARKWGRRLEGMTVVRYPDSAAALQAVINGDADAALVDGVTARLGVGQHSELRLAANVVDTLIAAAVHPESGVLRTRVDEAIDAMLADGTIAALIEKWFGPQD
jgi:polar amino acid transport system substrate-binding protein